MKLYIWCSVFVAAVFHLTAGQVDGDCYDCEGRNPCALGVSQRQFKYCKDSRKYVQCGEKGEQCLRKSCIGLAVWNQEVGACIHRSWRLPSSKSLGLQDPHCPSGKYNCEDKTPCTKQNAENGWFFFDHETSGKFVQCDEFQRCFTKSCPPRHVWEPASCACVKSA